METSGAEQLLDDAPQTQFVVLSLPQVQQLWATLRPLIERACQHSNGEIGIDAVTDGLSRGVYAVAIIASAEAIKAAAVFEVRDHECGSALWLLLAGGNDAAEWPKHDDELKAWARALGCGVIRMRPRGKGWLKVLPHWRWVMELDV